MGIVCSGLVRAKFSAASKSRLILKVVSVGTPSQDGWFIQQVQVMRWQILEPTAPTVEPR